MGIGGPATSALSILHQHGELDGLNSVIEIGAQDLNESHISFVLDFPHSVPKTTRALTNDEKLTAKGMLPQRMYQKIGITQYESIDTNGHNNAHVFDMNKDLAQDYGYQEKFDLVTNFGTTEHICNQAQIFKNIHDLCNVNGIMIGIVPFQGAVDHGFFNYQPLFFEHIALANDYDMNLYWTIASPQLYTQNVIPYNNELIKTIKESVRNKYFSYIPYEMEEELCYVFRKKNGIPFILPDQTYSGEGGQRIELKKNIHPIIKKEEFSDKSTQCLFIEYLSMYGHGNLYVMLLAASYYMRTKQYKLLIKRFFNLIKLTLVKVLSKFNN